MFARKQDTKSISRLESQAAFDLLRKTKIRWVSDGLALQVVDHYKKRGTLSLESMGFCVVASKKTAKQSTERNRMRRRLKAVALEILPSRACLDKDYMVIARAKTATRDFAALRQDLVWCLKKLDLLREP